MPSDETAKPCTPVQFRTWPPTLSVDIQKIASATRRRCTLVDLFGRGHWALDAPQLKPPFSEVATGVFGGQPALRPKSTLDYFVLCSKVLVLCGNYR